MAKRVLGCVGGQCGQDMQGLVIATPSSGVLEALVGGTGAEVGRVHCGWGTGYRDV